MSFDYVRDFPLSRTKESRKLEPPRETKHKLRQVNKNKWEFEIDTVVKFMIIESKAKSVVWVETNVDFIVPSSLEVVFEQLIENDYNTLLRSC